MTVNDGPLVACSAMLPTRSADGSTPASAAEKALTFWMSSSALMPTWPTDPPKQMRREHTTRHDTHTTRHTHTPLLRRYVPATCRVGALRRATRAVRWCSSTTAASGTSVGSTRGNLLILLSCGPRSRGIERMVS
jgi:hypothetical protein